MFPTEALLRSTRLVFWLFLLSLARLAWSNESLQALSTTLVQVLEKSRGSVFPILAHRHVPGAKHHEACQYRLGTAFLLEPEGLFLTSSNLILANSDYRILLPDEKLAVQFAGMDSLSNLALLQGKPAQPLQRLESQSTQDLRPGELVVLLGFSDGFLPDAGLALIGGVRKGIRGGRIQEFIQFNALGRLPSESAVLLSLEGSLLGVWLESEKPQNPDEPPHAMPIAQALALGRQLVHSGGQITRPYLGVQVEGPSLELGELLDPPQESRLQIVAVHPGSPAENAGLQAGDQILKLQSENAHTLPDLVHHIHEAGIGKTLHMTVLRESKPLECSATLTARNQEEQPRQPTQEWLGLELRNAGTPEEGNGVIVERILIPPLASYLGLQPGDRLIQLNGKEVVDVSQFEDGSWACEESNCLNLHWVRGKESFHAAYSPLFLRLDPAGLQARILRLEEQLRHWTSPELPAQQP